MYKRQGVERIGEQPGGAVEVEQYLVHHSDVYPPFFDGGVTAVSYTHLDVYKRQGVNTSRASNISH